MKDGGPAFPVLLQDRATHLEKQYEGMSLRDYLAAAALTGIIASGKATSNICDVAAGYKAGTTDAHAAFVWADAMLAEREKEA